MRKLAITITALLLCAVTALMLMSVGLSRCPRPSAGLLSNQLHCLLPTTALCTKALSIQRRASPGS